MTKKSLLIASGLIFCASACSAELPPRGEAQPVGALSGTTIYLSPGHGWWFTDGKWTTQRGNSFGVVEDLSNAETVLQFLVPYLWNAGADVVVLRERDMQTNMLILEAGDESVDLNGPWIPHQARNVHAGRQYAIETSTTGATASAAFVPNIPEAGYYAVYIWYAAPVDGPASRDTMITINHTGGSTLWVQDQTRDTGTWKYIGTYYFDEGKNPFVGSVVFNNASSEAGRYVVADAVRFGGGMGDYAPPGGTVSGRPRWEESGLYYTQFAGFDPSSSTRAFNQVRAMPRFAEWDSEPHEKGRSIYLAWHTNGSADHTMSGISSYIYGEYAWGPPGDFTGYPGGRELASHVHFNILNDVRAAYDETWEDVGIISRWLGETNPESNNKMPAALIENGYHDYEKDAGYILDPKFRRLSARAAYQGIVEYFAEEVEGFDNKTFLPEPPTHLAVRKAGMNEIEITWKEPPYDQGDGVLGHRAKSYRVYRSKNGKGFDNGTPVSGTRMTLDNITPGRVEYIKVAAVNDGGESLASEVLAVRIPERNEKARVLVINGFDRLDRGMNIIDTEVLPGQRVERTILSRMNTYDYIIPHAKSLHNAGWSFDSSSNEAVASGDVRLTDYQFVVWMLGRESSDDKAFDDVEQEKLRAFLNAGGNLFVSGSDIAFDLGGDRDPNIAFLRGALKAEFKEDRAQANGARGAAGGPFEKVGSITFGNRETYEVDSADVIAAVEGSRPAFTYQNGKTAAISFEGNYRLVYLAFPFETINDERTRNEVMLRGMAFLNGEKF